MADCKICGYFDETLPADWTNWECDQCVKEDIEGTTGAYSPAEKYAGDWLGKREVR